MGRMMLERDIVKHCKYCNKLMNHKRIYCDMSCRDKDYKVRLLGKNNPFYGKKHNIKLINRFKEEFKGIRRSIKTEFKKGIKPYNFKGKSKHSLGYIWVHSPNHPNRTKENYVLEHRLIMEKKMGRYLLPHEVVHHIDKNRKNNKITNLMLFNSNGEHLSYEFKGKSRKRCS